MCYFISNFGVAGVEINPSMKDFCQFLQGFERCSGINRHHSTRFVILHEAFIAVRPASQREKARNWRN